MLTEKEIIKYKNKTRAQISQRFFKTGVGEYGEGDIFLGITVPVQRALVKGKIPSAQNIQELLKSKYHEVRFCGTLLLVEFFKQQPKKAFDLYVKNTGVGKGINNWDLIDVSAHKVIGPYISTLTHEERVSFINRCIDSKDLWINRMIIVASFYQIVNKNEKLILFLAPHFLSHKHDLIHKAVGWMLREMGKRCGTIHLEKFLKQYASHMPRTMLRYSIEHFPKSVRKMYLSL